MKKSRKKEGETSEKEAKHTEKCSWQVGKTEMNINCDL